MKSQLLLSALLVVCALSAQEKGARPVLSSQGNPPSTTRAVVVGISDYQSPAITDLHYAHRDAEAFANWLRSPAGGSVDESNLVVLLNENATQANFAKELDELVEECREGDQAVIYFSGHGDLEYRYVEEPGFLLCWNAPPNVYTSGGAFDLIWIQRAVGTLIRKNKARVLLVTDACHAGKLAGTGFGGTELTNIRLAQQFDDEIRILSCQPNEKSNEGTQWGGGRGVFSYYLVDGLFGMADQDEDGLVTLSEIERHLEDNIAPEVAPMRQQPVVRGDKSTPLARVYPEILAEVKADRNGIHQQFLPLEHRGLEEEVLAVVDSSIQDLYLQYKAALSARNFFGSGGADSLYNLLAAEPALAPLHGALLRNYAAELQNEAQQAVNRMLQMNVQELTADELEKARQYRETPRMLERAATLLGTDHYLYSSLKSRQYLFEGMLKFLSTYTAVGRDSLSAPAILSSLRESLRWQPGSPATLYYLSLTYALRMEEPDSALVFANQAHRNAPMWTLPLVEMGYWFSRHYARFDEAKILLDQAMAIDSNDVFIWKSLGAWYYYQKRLEDARTALTRALDLDPNDAVVWVNLGALHLANRAYDPAEQAFRQSLRVDPDQYLGNLYMGKLFELRGDLPAAEAWYLNAIRFNPMKSEARTDLGRIYLKQDRLDEAEAQYLAVAEQTNPEPLVWFYLAALFARNDRTEQALVYLENALKKGYSDRNTLETLPEMESLRQTEQFRPLLDRYLPPKD